jgi:hypothetical protein
MSETIVWRVGRLYMIDVASIGYPLWRLRIHWKPWRHSGLVAEIETPRHSYEVRWGE